MTSRSWSRAKRTVSVSAKRLRSLKKQTNKERRQRTRLALQGTDSWDELVIPESGVNDRDIW